MLTRSDSSSTTRPRSTMSSTRTRRRCSPAADRGVLESGELRRGEHEPGHSECKRNVGHQLPDNEPVDLGPKLRHLSTEFGAELGHLAPKFGCIAAEFSSKRLEVGASG